MSSENNTPGVNPWEGPQAEDFWPKRRSTMLRMLGAAAGVAGSAMLPGAASVAAEGAPATVIGERVRRVDVHAHYIPDQYRAALQAAGHGKPSGMPGVPKWSVGHALETMDRLRIDAAIISISAPGLHFGDDAAARKLARYVNDEGANAVRMHPTRFGLFASLPLPDVDGAMKEIDYAFDTLKADGIVMESNYNGVYLGDPKLEPVFAELNRRGATIFLHPTNPHCPCCQDTSALPPIGYPFPMIEFMFETTRAVFNLILSGTLDRYPKLNLIVPHAGATVSILADRVAGLAPALGLAKPLDPDAFFKTLNRLYYDLAGFPEPRQLGALLQIADPKRVMYGSDWPYTPEPLVANLAQKLDMSRLLTPQMHKAFMRDNALSLFPRFAR